MADKKRISLQLTFDENLKRGSNLPTTERLAFDDLGDFIEERERIKRLLERKNSTELKVDYSDFVNHVFFDSAEEKLNIATNRILDNYPFNGTSEEKDAFELTGSGYENYLLEQWPREVAYTVFNGTTQFITASDSSTKLHLGSSSLYVSAWADPYIQGERPVVQYLHRNSNALEYSEFFDQWTAVRSQANESTEVAPVSGGYVPFILHESASLGNEIKWSEDFTTTWGDTRCTVIANTTAAPDGTTTADTLHEDNSAATTHYVGQAGMNVVSGTTYYVSVYAKAINRHWIRVQGQTPVHRAYYDVLTGTVGTALDTDATGIESVGNGWYKCWLTFTPASNNSNYTILIFASDSDGGSNFDGLDQDSYYFWGAHFEEASSEQSYAASTATTGTDNYFETAVIVPSGNLCVYSIYGKSINRDWGLLEYDPEPTGSYLPEAYAYFDFASGTVGTTGGGSFVNASVQALSGGWYRALMLFTGSKTDALLRIHSAEGDGDVFHTPVEQDALYLYGAQLYTYFDEKTFVPESVPYLITSGSEKESEVLGYQLYFSGTADPFVKFNLFSGSTTVSVSATYMPYTGSWNNVAAIYDTQTDLLHLYINNIAQLSATANLNAINIPASDLLVGSGSNYHNLSSTFALYSGALDEVRVLHTASQLFHSKNYNRPITAEEYVKLHYKFNEGVTGTGSVDSFVVDYSQSGLHGRYYNYTVDQSRLSGNIMLKDSGDPILYSFDDRVVAFTGTLALSASLYDLNNNNNIFNLIPEGVLLEDDLANGLLRSFSLAMARFFDDIKLYADQFVNTRVTNYEGIDETPDIFLPYLKRYFGWKVSEHFDDSAPLEFLFGENVLSTGSLDVSLSDIRNQFWRRILNNFPLLMKSKGTRKNIDYLLNVLGLNKDNVRIKEYGYLPGTSIQDERIAKQKVQYRLGIGTGSIGTISSSFITVNSSSLFDTSDLPSAEYTIETMVQLPFASASYSGSILSGGLWQLDSTDSPADALTSSIRCVWVRDSVLTETGKIILEASSSADIREYLTSSDLTIFDGNFVHVAAGLNPSSIPFISVRKIDGSTMDLSADFTGSAAFSVTASSNHSLFIGANTSSVVFTNRYDAQGFFGEARFWDKKLSGSEVDDHAFNFQSIGTKDPFGEDGEVLRAHWALNENNVTDAAGILSGVVDLSRNSRDAKGLQFNASESPYEKFLHDFNYLSPSIDLKWTENKVRIRNTSELKFDAQASDTNELSLEFNFIDSLNEDIVKIFSTLDTLNNLIGQPIFKYRDEYSDLEGVRRDYFQRLGDQLNFTQFFNLFKWFDKKISDSIKQILPARVKFIGGEQVIESHLLERPKYKYQYPIFRTPQEVPEIEVDASAHLSSSDKMLSIEASDPFYGTSVFGEIDAANKLINSNKDIASGSTTLVRPSSMNISVTKGPRMVSMFADGDTRVDNANHGFFKRKVSGDQENEVNNPNTAINFKNEKVKETARTTEAIEGKLGSDLVKLAADSSLNQEHYFTGAKKYLGLIVRGLSGSVYDESGVQFTLSGTSQLLGLSQSLYTSTNARLSGAELAGIVKNTSAHQIFGVEVTFKVSSSDGNFVDSNVDILFKDDNSPPWLSLTTLTQSGDFSNSADDDGFHSFSRRFELYESPIISYDVANAPFQIKNITGTHTYKDVVLSFVDVLSDAGVEKIKKFDNQDLELFNLNTAVMPDIEG